MCSQNSLNPNKSVYFLFLQTKTTSLPSVEVPLPGSSYNPSYTDHQDLLWKAAVVELNKEKAIQKIEYHTTRMFPDAKDAPTEQTWLAEMSEGIGENAAAEDSEDEEGEKEEEGEINRVGERKQTFLLNDAFSR